MGSWRRRGRLRGLVMAVALGGLVAPGHADPAEHVVPAQPPIVPEGEAGPPLPRSPGFLQHEGAVSSISFSPDGKVLASGSSDNTVRLWDLATSRLLDSLTGHQGRVNAVSFSPDGKVLASGSSDNTVRLWDIATGRLLDSLTGHSNWVRAVSFSPDGTVLASGSSDSSVRLWDVATGRRLHSLTGHEGDVTAVSFSPDDKVLASGSSDNTVRLWDVATGRLLHSLTGHEGSVSDVSFRLDGKVLASGSSDNTVRLWDVATGRLLHSLAGRHLGDVNAVSFSPDGQVLASGSSDNTVRLWDVATGRLLHSLIGHLGDVNAVSFSPDSQVLASGSSDNTVRLWDVATGRLLHSLIGHWDWVQSVSFSPDGKVLASGSSDSAVRLWDVATGRLLHSLTGHEGGANAVSFSPDGQVLASGSDDVYLWDVATGRLLHSFTGHEGGANAVSFSPDGQVLASGSDDVYLWDVATGRLLHSLTGHELFVRAVSFSPDGKILASSSSDDSVYVWDVATGRLLHSLTDHEGFVHDVSFSPDGKVLAFSDSSKVRLWDVATGRLLNVLIGHEGFVHVVSFSPDGKVLASSSVDSLSLWDVATGRLLHSLTGHAGSIFDMSFSPDGKVLASCMDGVRLWDVATGRLLHFLTGHEVLVHDVSFSPDGKVLASGLDRVRLWDVATGRLLHSLTGHEDDVNAVSFSPDGKILAVGSDDQSVRLWDVATGRLLDSLTGHEGSVTAVSFSPDGKVLASGSVSVSDDKPVRLWNVATGRLLDSLIGHEGDVSAVSFSPDGKVLASGSDDKSVRLWDAATGRLLHSLTGHTNWVRAVSFSPDGKVLASGSFDSSVRLWDVATGRLLYSLTGHEGGVRAVNFSPDGKVLASGSDDKSVRLWDAATGRLLHSLTGHEGWVMSVSFSPDGKILASGSNDKTIRLYNAETGHTTAVMQSFGHGAWMTRLADGTLYRADYGIQIQTRDHWHEDFRPLMPPRPLQGSAELVASTTGTSGAIALRDGRANPDVKLRVENRGDAPAYWVRLLVLKPFSGGFLADATAWRSRLDPGESFDIPVQISHLHRPTPDQPEPGPRQGTVTLWLTSAYGEDIAVPIDVQVQAPVLKVADLQVLSDFAGGPAALQVSVINTGKQDPELVDAAIEFVDAESGDIVATTARQQASDSLPGGQTTAPLSFTIPTEVHDHANKIQARVVLYGGLAPSHRWTALHALDLGRSWTFYLAIAFAVLLALGAVTAYQLIFRNPVVLRYDATPDELTRVPITDVAHVQRRLERARRLAPLLEALDIPRTRWDRLVPAASDPVKVLADVWRAELEPGEATGIDGLVMHRIVLPTLPIPIESRTAIVEVFESADLDRLPENLERLVTEHSLQGRYLLVVDRTGRTTGQTAGFAVGSDLANHLADAPIRLAVINPLDITVIFLSSDPVTGLCRIIARMARLGDISPYQTSGGLDRPGQFVGRQNEVALLTGRDACNHLLIGARQMGKSSLLKRLVRRDPARIHMVTMTGAELDRDLQRAGLPPLDRIAELAEPGQVRAEPSANGAHAASPNGAHAAGIDAPVPFLLIDEADRLIRADRDNDFAICRHLRAISEEGRCRFILAGFWELHRAAYQDHQSPLRNFADPLPLGPLDEQAARTLATRPLEALGLRWASDELVTELLTRTGRRPNLIALATDAAIRALPPLAERILDAEILRATLDMSDATGAPIATFFQSVGALISDERACRIDRMILYASIAEESFTLKQARTRIEATGARVPIEELQESLDRLTLAYAIQKRSGAYIFPVPLLRDYFHDQSEGEPAERLELEAREWIEEQG